MRPCPASRSRPLRIALSLLLATACGVPGTRGTEERAQDDAHGRLPTGVRLDPAAPLVDVGAMPLTMIAAPERDRVVLLLNGWGDEGIQVADRSTGRVLQTLRLPAVFLGLAFAPDGHTLYVSGGNRDVIYRYDWNGLATLRDSIVLQAPAAPRANGRRYPAGIAVSHDGRTLYAAENLADSLAVVDVATGRVRHRVATGRYPYGVVALRDGRVYVSNWGSAHLSAWLPDGDGLRATTDIPVGRHPSALLANAAETRLFVASATTERVASVDLTTGRVAAELRDPPPSGPDEGSTPNALALSDDGTRLFVAEGDANAVAVFDLGAGSSGVASATGDDHLAGRIPAGWYPTAVLARGDTLLVASAKGRGTRANPDGPGPRSSRDRRQAPGRNTTLSQLTGALMVAPLARADSATLAGTTSRVARANGWTGPLASARRYPPIEHVIYVIKENRTYDQVLGDLAHADGDSTLTYFPRAVTPNQHALAERFGIFDRFFVNAEVSADGHNWSTAAYTTDYLQKNVQLTYSARGRPYVYEGSVPRAAGDADGDDDADDVNAPARGYFWTLAQQKGISFRNYGEFVIREGRAADTSNVRYRGSRPYLAAHTNPRYPGFDLRITDQRRADVWLAELAGFTRTGAMPALEVVRLPNDHTSGATAGLPTPRAYAADNDLALGRMIEALSRTPFWKSTAVFVVEDDAQNGPDHVDSHRAPFLVISPWARAGLAHRYTNTTDVLRTMEEILGLDALSHFDHHGRPLRDIWADTPDTSPYVALVPGVALDERNPSATRGARESSRLDLRTEDAADEDQFNRILWRAARGERPYPGASRAASFAPMP